MTRKLPRLRIPHEVVSLIRGLHPRLKRKIRAALEMLWSEPYADKVLKNDLSGLRSFRVSRFGIVYRISGKQEVEIIAVGPRRHIYEETYKLVSREDRES
jgi:mRNA interferase RelE/StbE